MNVQITLMLKFIQLAVSITVSVLFWLIYPGVMALFASIVGICYIVASLGAIRDFRVAICLAFVFTTLTAGFSWLAVYRFVGNGFDFLAGNFAEINGIYFPPYLILFISLGSSLVVITHLVSWWWKIQ